MENNDPDDSSDDQDESSDDFSIDPSICACYIFVKRDTRYFCCHRTGIGRWIYMSYMTALHILLWKGALLAQKLKNHLRCWFVIMLTLLASMLLPRTLRVCWSIYLRSRSRLRVADWLEGSRTKDLNLGADSTSGSGHYPGQST